MRRPLLLIACALLPLTILGAAAEDRPPVTGRPVESLSAFDRAMIAYMEECGLSGGTPGTTAMVRQRPDGVVIAALFNGRRDLRFREDLESLRRRLDEAADSIERW